MRARKASALLALAQTPAAAAGDQHHPRRLMESHQLFGDREAVQIRKLDIQQDHIRP